MITGAQIREARALLGWEPLKVASLADLELGDLIPAKSVAGKPALTSEQNAALHLAFETAGIVFAEASDEGPGVRLRQA